MNASTAQKKPPLSGAKASPQGFSSDDPEDGAPDLEAYWEHSKIPADRDHPDVPILPPYLYGGALVIALILEVFTGGDFFRFAAQISVGLLTLSFGAGLLAWCLTLFANEGTNIEPYKPATTLVTAGPYGFSRNPIYVALCAIYLGLSVLFDITWGFVLFPALVLAVQYLVIVREETYLEEKFGQQYRDYCKSVRRWL